MFCRKCGKELPENSSYCDGCGAMIEEETAEKAVRSVAAAANPVPAQKKKPFGWVAVLVTGAVLIVLAVFAGSFLMDMGLGDLFKNSEKQQEVHVSPGETEEYDRYFDTLSDDNQYAECFRKYSDYVLPESSERYLSCRDVEGLSVEEIEIAIMEMQARQGRQFAQRQVQAYFDARAWYTPAEVSYEPNAYESANELLLRVYQGKLDGSIYRQGNKYLEQFPENRDYVVADSDSRYMTAEDLKTMNAEQLILARNEMYARKGCIFQTEELQTYFYTKDWYVPSLPVENFKSGELNKYEKNNIEFVGIYEKRLEGVAFSADNPYISVFEKYRNARFILTGSSDWKMTESDLLGLTVEELIIARNEIYARNGYTFSSENLLEYFLQTDWYYPNTPCGDSDALSFSKLEKDNISLLKERETYLENGGDAGGSDDIVQESKYVYRVDGNCYHIPVVEALGVNASAMNSKLYDTYHEVLQQQVFSTNRDERFLLGLTYTVGQRGDVVSVTVLRMGDFDLDDYDVYYFSASTGKELTAADVFRACGVSEEQGRSMAEKAMEAYWEEMGQYAGVDEPFFREQKERTLADSNIEAVRPLISADGQLQFVGEIYSLAGADSYMHRFDQSGEFLETACKIH